VEHLEVAAAYSCFDLHHEYGHILFGFVAHMNIGIGSEKLGRYLHLHTILILAVNNSCKVDVADNGVDVHADNIVDVDIDVLVVV